MNFASESEFTHRSIARQRSSANDRAGIGERRTALGLALTLLVVLSPIPGASAAGDENTPDIGAILKLADEATLAVRALEYDVEYYAEGEHADRVPRVTGRVLARQGRHGFFLNPMAGAPSDDAAPAAFRFTGTVAAPEGVSRAFDVATDGDRVVSIEAEARRYVFGDTAAMALVYQLKPLFMLEYFHPTPFHDEITSREQRYEGVVKVGDVECDVIRIAYQRPFLDARWYFGREDHLPRRVDRIRFRGSQPVGERILVLKNLNTTPSFEADVFAPPPPPGFDQRAFTPGKRRPDDAAAPAPDFALKTPEGKTIRLSELRGNVVVLDFWSTWCLPCKLSMPHMQSLHEKYADKPVKVFGLNCWDHDGDPVKLMRDMKLTYGLLLGADGVAREYGVESIPAVFVITPDGKICFSQSGVVPSLERKIDRAIQQALNEAVDSDD